LNKKPLNKKPLNKKPLRKILNKNAYSKKKDTWLWHGDNSTEKDGN
jgi:hypothetical protein